MEKFNQILGFFILLIMLFFLAAVIAAGFSSGDNVKRWLGLDKKKNCRDNNEKKETEEKHEIIEVESNNNSKLKPALFTVGERVFDNRDKDMTLHLAGGIKEHGYDIVPASGVSIPEYTKAIILEVQPTKIGSFATWYYRIRSDISAMPVYVYEFQLNKIE